MCGLGASLPPEQTGPVCASGGWCAGPSTFPEAGPFPELGCGDQPDWLEDKCMVGENGEALVRALSWVGNSCPEERGEHLSLFY